MKHIDIKKFAEKKTCIVLTIILFIILSILYIAGYIDINKRFPKPKEELYETGQYIEYKDGIKIKGLGVEYCSSEQFKEKYLPDDNSKFDHIVVKIMVFNETDTVIDMAYLNQYFNLVIYPAGYENQGECILDNNYIKPKEEREIYIGYNVSEAILASEKREKVLKHDIMFCLKAYPVRQAIVFKGIEGYEEDK